MSPYIVTTRRQGRQPGKEHDAAWSRRAVATLDEAQEHVADIIDRHGSGGSYFAWPASGGQLKPLPDGTVIEVTQCSLTDLAREARVFAQGMNDAEMCDAFNAMEETA